MELYRRWVEAESVRENLEKETLSLKRKIQRTLDAEKKLSQLSQDLQAQKEKRDALKTGEADLKARIEEMKGHHKAKIEELKLENADLEAKVEDLQATKTWLLSEGAKLLAKNIHKGSEITAAVSAVNNAMRAVGIYSGLQNGYIHALKKKTPYAEVPLLNRNAEDELNTAFACFDSHTFQVIEDLSKLVNEPLSKIKDALFFASGESSVE
ncbi:hypothetical protein Hanom_Chr05g00391551 [Helianthus anomalus]